MIMMTDGCPASSGCGRAVASRGWQGRESRKLVPLPSVEPRTRPDSGVARDASGRRPDGWGKSGSRDEPRARAAEPRAAPKFSKTLRVPLPDVEPQLHPPFPRVRPHQLLGEAYIDVVREPLAVDDALAIDRIHRGPLLV
jgi:hypothetical protein